MTAHALLLRARDPSACDVWIATNKEEAPKLKKGFRCGLLTARAALRRAASCR